MSIAVWVPFNEGWGQFDAARVAARVKALDPTRTVDHASGWHDQRAGDLRSLHVYFKPFRVPRRRDRRVLVLSEYGGYNLRVEGRDFSEKDFGYKKLDDAAALGEAFVALHRDQIVPAIPRGLSATVYTQLSGRRGRAQRPADVRPRGREDPGGPGAVGQRRAAARVIAVRS